MAHRMFRGRGWSAAAAGLVLAGTVAGISGVAADATSTAPQAIRAHLAYICRFPSGSWQAAVTVAASFPATAVVGQPIRPAGLSTALTLPRAVLAGLTRLGAAQVSGSDVLTTSVAYGASVTARPWPGRLPPSLTIPATGSLAVTGTGPVAPVTATAPGSVTFSAASLALTLAPRKADGSATSPATVHVACILGPGQAAALATVPVITAASPSPSATPSSRPPPAAAGHKPPKGCEAIKVKAPQISCGYITGYADVSKLNGAVLLQPPRPQKPGLVSVAENTHVKNVHGGIKLFNVGQLYYKGKEELPPVQATLLGFGFEPITATLQIKELTPIKIVVKLYKIVLVKITATTKVSFRLSNATVNGVPWKNLGPGCETSQPIKLQLVGRGNTSSPGTGFFNLAAGGTLGGLIKIPNFTHCGVGENLDPVFNASISSVSGPLNFTLMTQGALCFVKPFFPKTCPPPVPKPKRHLDTGCPIGKSPPSCH